MKKNEDKYTPDKPGRLLGKGLRECFAFQPGGI